MPTQAPAREAPWSLSEKTRPYRFLAATLLVLVVSLFSHATYGIISEDNLVLFYLVGVIVTALYLGRGPALWAAFANFFMLDLGVLHPRYQMTQPDIQYVLSLATFLVIAQLISSLADSVRRQAWQAVTRERQTGLLYEFSRALAGLKTRDEVADLVAQHYSQAFGLTIEIEWNPDSETSTPGYPIRSPRALLGVARSVPPARQDAATFLESLLNQAALAVEQFELSEQASRARILEATEKLQSALLNSISHDLQTPLASISGTIQVLRDPDVRLAEKDRQALLDLAGQESTRLRRLVDNVLNLSRLEGGALQLNASPASVEDLLATVVAQTPAEARPRLKVECQEGLPEVRVDYILMTQVLHNLVENACKYSPAGSSVELSGSLRGLEVHLAVTDHGPGVPEEEREKCFERFHRGVSVVNTPGSGLGLSICRGVVEAHQGRIWVEADQGGGARFVVSLPSHKEAR